MPANEHDVHEEERSWLIAEIRRLRDLFDDGRSEAAGGEPGNMLNLSELRNELQNLQKSQLKVRSCVP